MEVKRPTFDELFTLTEEEYNEKYLNPQLEELNMTYEEFDEIRNRVIDDYLPF